MRLLPNPYRYSNCSLLIFLAMFVNQGSASTINVGEHQLQPNQAGQSIVIDVSGGGNVAGLNFYVQVGDGGPEIAQFGVPAGTDGPAIASVDLKGGTIFSTASTPQDNQPGIPQVAVASIELTTPGQFVSAAGRLAQLTVDTTGFHGGRWELKLSDVLAGLPGGPFRTDFAGIPIDINNGWIDVVPTLLGDMNLDGTLNQLDINTLANVIRQGTGAPFHDLDRSSAVNGGDYQFLIEEILNTFPGDANLDRAINEADFGAWNMHQFRTGTEWESGDFNGDGLTDGADFNLWIEHRGLVGAPSSVPEPTLASWFLAALAVVCRLRARPYYRSSQTKKHYLLAW